jgi:hypothetical protein
MRDILAALGFVALLFIIVTLFLISQEATLSKGPLILGGGGVIPRKAIEWTKSHSKTTGECVVVSNSQPDKRWAYFFDKVVYIKPEELENKSIDDIRVCVIGGGDQLKYLHLINKSFVQKIHDAKIPIIFNSAGSMLAGSHIFSAEFGSLSSFEAVSHPELVTIECDFLDNKYLKSTVIDTHYHERNRQERLKLFMEIAEVDFGIGIDEETALIISSGGIKTIFGEGSVSFIEREKIK